jgi:shikimate kinase
MKVFLVGFMGSGKSTLGKKLSELMNVSFIDLDNRIEESEGKSVSEIFKERGEEYFRNLEAEALRKTSRIRNAVIATGGGAPCFYDNMEWMNENGVTVYLKAEAGELYHRLLKERETRPLLAHLGDVALFDYIMSSLAHREPYYALATFKLPLKTATPAAIISRIKGLEKRSKKK